MDGNRETSWNAAMGEIAEFRHIAGAFFGMIVKHKIEQQVALLGDECELRAVEHAHVRARVRGISPVFFS